MKTVVVLCVLVATIAARPESTYDARYDNFDAQELVDNTRLLKAYGNCFLDKGPCTSDGAAFKKKIPEALSTNCVKCSPKQRELIRTVVRGFKEKLPELYEELRNKEDPDGKYKETFNEFLNSTD